MELMLVAALSVLTFLGWIYWPRNKPQQPTQHSNSVCILTVDSLGNEMRIYRSVKPGEQIRTISDSYITKLKQERL